MQSSKSFCSYLQNKKLLCPPMRPEQYIIDSFKCEGDTNEDNIKTCEENSGSDHNDYIKSVLSNYVILKKIMGEFTSWQDLKIMSLVCKAWFDVVKNTVKSEVMPRYFCLYAKRDSLTFEKSGYLKLEPMLILTFANSKAFKLSYKCDQFPDSPCDANCKEKHKMLDYINVIMSYPLNALVGISCPQVVYVKPKPKENQPQVGKCPIYSGQIKMDRELTFLGGVYIPKIPNVNVHIKSYPKTGVLSTEVEYLFFQEIVKIMNTEIIKCLLIFGGSSFHKLEDFLQGLVNLITETQGEDNPVAIGGCKIDFSFLTNYNYCKPSNAKEMTLIMLTVDKSAESTVQFDAYSRVFIAQCGDDHGKDVEPKMKKMSTSIPKREHSIGLKLSCVGRTDLDELEQNAFCKYFPSTSLVGCYGQKEVGVNCLPATADNDIECISDIKRRKIYYEEEEKELFHSYSTVIVILTWGKLLSNQSDKF